MDWVNKTFSGKNSEISSNKEALVSSLVGKLQLYVQQVNEKIEDTSQNILYDLPSIVKDVQNLQNEAMILKNSISEVEKQIATVQEETGSDLDRLEYLDNLKIQLQVAKQGLQESDCWGVLTSELEDLLERNDILNACDKLFALQSSLAAQRALPGQVERTQQVEDFKNRLEALASIPVVQNFTSGNIEESKKFVKIFKTMERFKQLTQYFRSVQKTNLQRQWVEIIETAENTNSERFLRDFYEILLENVYKQGKWCSQVFEDSSQAVLIVAELLPSLQPNRETVITNALKRSNDKLLILKEISSANIFFGQLMQKYISTQDKLISDDLQISVANGIYSYFSTFIGQYAAIEQNTIAQSIADLPLAQSSATESVRSLNLANSKITFWLEESIKRCEDVTQNCAIGPLVTIVNGHFKTYLEKYKKAQRQIESSRSSHTEQQDWSLLQVCISLMQNVGDLKLHVDNIESKLVTAILDLNEKLQKDDEFFRYRMASKREEKDFKKLVTLINEGNKVNKSILCTTVMDTLQPLCGEIHDSLLAIIFTPVEGHLKQVTTHDLFNQSTTTTDLPDYSFVPLEYITLVGQYILTLPQHLEPLLISTSVALKTALELSDMKYGKDAHSADILLSLIAEECCAMYQEQIAALNVLTPSGSKQLATDIGKYKSQKFFSLLIIVHLFRIPRKRFGRARIFIRNTFATNRYLIKSSKRKLFANYYRM